MSGEAFSKTQFAPSALTAKDDWFIGAILPIRASAQFRHAQFH
jgi:hypothetical protein